VGGQYKRKVCKGSMLGVEISDDSIILTSFFANLYVSDTRKPRARFEISQVPSVFGPMGSTFLMELSIWKKNLDEKRLK
jgi:hypothetical protein